MEEEEEVRCFYAEFYAAGNTGQLMSLGSWCSFRNVNGFVEKVSEIRFQSVSR